MRSLGVVACILGVFITSGAVDMYFTEIEGAGIACMVLGGGLFVIGVMIFLADLAVRLSRRAGKLVVRFEFLKLRVDLHAELEKLEGETEPSALDRWLDKSLSEVGIG